jgi:hypothetical protein
MTKILLDPVDFDALHLSALAFGGIGGWRDWKNGEPWCVQGHAAWVEGQEPPHPDAPFSTQDTPLLDRVQHTDPHLPNRNDDLIASQDPRVPFEEYIKRLNIDVKEGA